MFHTRSEFSVFLKETGDVCDRTQCLKPTDLGTHFFVISCTSVKQSGARDLVQMCPVPKL